MKVTVILCTYNRCQSLAKALESAAEQVVPPSTEWEVLVIDNNSPDQTRQVVENFSGRFPGRFRYLFEPRPGKSFALDAGIRNSQSDVLAFMDDDVITEPNWLNNLTSTLQDPRWAGAGGRILAQWPCAPPEWLQSSEAWATAPLVMFDKGPEAGQLSEPPFGTNMAFQRSMFEKHGGFRTDLGPRPGSEIRSEDTEFGRRLLDAGELFWYEPSAVVYHAVPQNRISQNYFLKWWFDKGRGDMLEDGLPDDQTLCIAGVPLYLFRRLAVWTVRWTFTPSTIERFSSKLKVWWLLGQIKECRALAQRSLPAAAPQEKPLQ